MVSGSQYMTPALEMVRATIVTTPAHLFRHPAYENVLPPGRHGSKKASAVTCLVLFPLLLAPLRPTPLLIAPLH